MVTGLVRQGLCRNSVKALVLVCALLIASAVSADTRANRLASGWLGLIDSGAFLTSWTGAAPLLQQEVSAKKLGIRAGISPQTFWQVCLKRVGTSEST